MSTEGVTPKPITASHLESVGLQEKAGEHRVRRDLDQWMERYQRADPEAPGVLIEALSPGLLRFFRSQIAVRAHADDLLQETWLRIHRMRHTYRPGEPLLPWVYAIARRARVDCYRRVTRVSKHEKPLGLVPEPRAELVPEGEPLSFEMLIAALPAAQREVVTMLKVSGLTLEEVARATSSTVGAVKQKAHRAYERMRRIIQSRAAK